MRIPIHPGDQIDHYRIESVEERRGYSSVFRAVDMRTSTPVAIKVPDPEMESDPVFFERFQREEEIGRTLDHPGILKVIVDGERSQTYIVTEWFAGTSLRHVLEAGKLPQERAVQIALNVSTVLTYIHNRGVMHRDLRPENILIGANDEVKLINFGAAAKTGARRITFTNMANVIGVSEYVSPEELNGKRDDARSDIYALGVILYEMLTGRLPFPGASPYDRLLQHPVPPRSLEPSISPQLQEVIYRALERQAKNRYAHAQDLASDLTHLDRVGVANRPELREWQKTPPSRWKRVLVPLGVAVIPLAIFVLLLLFARR